MEFRVIEIPPPICPHGPTVLFEPHDDDYEDDTTGQEDNGGGNKRMKGGRKGEQGSSGHGGGGGGGNNKRPKKPADKTPYFACSAYRCQKECNFKMSRDRWAKMDDSQRTYSNISRCPPSTGELINYIFADNDPSKEYGFCYECCRVLIPIQDTTGMEESILKEHIFGTHIMKRCKNVVGQLKRSFFSNPTTLLTPAKSNRGQSQYFFADPVKRFIVKDIIQKLGFKRILCIGCPTIFELLQKDPKMDAFLLDIDYRFAQFIHPNQFSRFNMFNYFFFDDQLGEDSVREFLSRGNYDNTLIICDPPFGVRLAMLKKTIRRFQAMIPGWEDTNIDDEMLPYPAFCLCFPYFNEHWIKTVFGDHLKRTDFVMFYSNHGKFKLKNNGLQLSSPVRMFTNLDRSKIDLKKLNGDINPKDPYYSDCSICKRSVFKTNKHCPKCNDCSAREANKPYRHCDTCGTCYKSTWAHCEKCKRCHLFMNCPKGTRSPLVDGHVVQNVSMLVNEQDDELYLLTQSQMKALQNGDRIEFSFRAQDEEPGEPGDPGALEIKEEVEE